MRSLVNEELNPARHKAEAVIRTISQPPNDDKKAAFWAAFIVCANLKATAL